MKIFITGATGFIGRHLMRRLALTGHECTCLVRKTSRVDELKQSKARLVYGDVTDADSVRAGMAGCDTVLHLANLYAMWHLQKQDFTDINVEGTRHVMEAALELGVKKVIYVSTVAVYGRPTEYPFNEESQPGPTLFSEYARTKAQGEALAWELARTRGLPLVSLYPGIVLGGDDDKASGEYIQTLINRRTPTPIYTRSIETYVYVQDVVDAIIKAAEKTETTGQKYLIGKHAMNGLDYARLVCEIAGVPMPPFRFPDWFVTLAGHWLTFVSRFTHQPPWWGLSVDAGNTLYNGFYYDGSKAERELGITYSPLRQALAEAIASYRAREKRK